MLPMSVIANANFITSTTNFRYFAGCCVSDTTAIEKHEVVVLLMQLKMVCALIGSALVCARPSNEANTRFLFCFPMSLPCT